MTIGNWLVNFRNDPVFHQPPASRQEFDIWSFQMPDSDASSHFGKMPPQVISPARRRVFPLLARRQRGTGDRISPLPLEVDQQHAILHALIPILRLKWPRLHRRRNLILPRLPRGGRPPHRHRAPAWCVFPPRPVARSGALARQRGKPLRGAVGIILQLCDLLSPGR